MPHQHRTICISALIALSGVVAEGQPRYQIIDLGVVTPGDFASQGSGVSPGGIGVGRSVGSDAEAWSWTPTAGLVPLQQLAGRDFAEARGANDAGQVAGVAATTSFGSSPLPVLWSMGNIEMLDTIGSGAGRANDVNDRGIAVGSVGGGVGEIAVWWDSKAANAITATTPEGAAMRVAFANNNNDLIVGSGVDPLNAARNVGLHYDRSNDTMTEIPGVIGLGHNGTIAFDVSENGFIVGSSSFNQSNSRAFIWEASGGSTDIPLPSGTSMSSARGVNSNGWVVGVASGAFAVPFLWDGSETYRLQDLLVESGGWDLASNTFSAALGISEDGTIIGTGVLDGDIRAFAMTLEQACVADLAEPTGVLNFFDVAAYIALYNAGDPSADLAAPFGSLNFFDVSAFISAFNAGCP